MKPLQLLNPSTQLLFESVYNYFPITFKPPPNDPYHITAQDLKDRLQDCLSATSQFAPYVFPALIDKLDSTSVNVKVTLSLYIYPKAYPSNSIYCIKVSDI